MGCWFWLMGLTVRLIWSRFLCRLRLRAIERLTTSATAAVFRRPLLLLWLRYISAARSILRLSMRTIHFVIKLPVCLCGRCRCRKTIVV